MTGRFDPPDRVAGRADVLPALAQPLLGLARRIESDGAPDPVRLAEEARQLVLAFETGGRDSRLPADWILDARDALIVLLDTRARNNPALSVRRWERALATALPVCKTLNPRRLAESTEAAARAGLARRDLARFLGHCNEAVQVSLAARTRRTIGTDHALAYAAVGLFLLCVAAWAGWAEWQFRQRLLAQLPDVQTVIATGRSAPPALRAAALDGFLAAARQVEQDAGHSPLGLVARFAATDPAAEARSRYGHAVDALAAEPLAEVISAALATEGESGMLYDSLRAWSILAGRSAWQPDYLAGWISDREAAYPEMAALAPHLSAMTGPPSGIAPVDPETLSQARQFAAESTPDERAFLELTRAAPTAALPFWRLENAVPGLERILIRSSGLPIERGIPGLYTAAGWDYARADGAREAVREAASQSAALLGAKDAASADTVMDILQKRSIDVWTGYLADLRVRPFLDQPTALEISGVLSARNSPLATLIREAWHQSGGTDRRRSQTNQLRVAASLGPAIQFVEQGRMGEISQLFISLNVAIALLDADAAIGKRTLMDAQERANSIVALQQAPLLVVQIVEDVLAQTASPQPAPVDRTAQPEAAVAVAPAVPGQAGWSAVSAACDAVTRGHYPFSDGPDANLAEVARVFGRGGEIDAYFRKSVAPLMDMSATPWRWKPEARLSGYTAEGAVFIEKSLAIGGALFPNGAAPNIPVALEALAQRGAATVSIGGAHASVATSGDKVTMNWPGASPAAGMEIAFDSDGGREKQSAPGPWGLIRLLDTARVRPRDGGKRLLVDVRTKSARSYIQMTFTGSANPFAARALMKGLTCVKKL